MNLVTRECCESVLSLLHFGIVKPCLIADAILVKVLLHCEEAVQRTLLHFVLFAEFLDAGLLSVD